MHSEQAIRDGFGVTPERWEEYRSGIAERAGRPATDAEVLLLCRLSLAHLDMQAAMRDCVPESEYAEVISMAEESLSRVNKEIGVLLSLALIDGGVGDATEEAA